MAPNDGTLNYRVLVGMEIHVQLGTASKMFTAAPNHRHGAEPNSLLDPIVLGMPGVLPVMNQRAFEFAVRTALALDCKIAQFTKWDRKSYYYPDLPKNYQISQYDLPLASKGRLTLPLPDGGDKDIRIRRLHLEEDVGKLHHEAPGGGRIDHSLVDLNRAGCPLMEIVTEPDLTGPEEVSLFAEELRSIVRYLGVSDGNMQMGQMRFEPNINLVITDKGKEYRTPIVEVKNLSSFRALSGATAFEAKRQLDDWQTTGRVMESGNKSTRGWDESSGQTVLQREKEEAHDYRYFPDPDLMPVVMDDDWLERIRATVCELPIARRLRYQQAFGLSAYDAAVLTAEKAASDYFEAAVAQGAPAKRAVNLIQTRGLKLANERDTSVAALGISPARLADLAKLVEAGQLSATAAGTVFDIMLTESAPPLDIAQRQNLIQQSDAGELEAVVAEVLDANPKAVADVQAGGKKSKAARGFLMGQVMKRTRGSANPKIVTELLEKKLS